MTKYKEGQYVILKEDMKTYQVIGPFPKEIHEEQEYRLEHKDVRESEILKLLDEERYAILPCRRCGKELRFPTDKGALEITCPECRYKFTFQLGGRNKVPDEKKFHHFYTFRIKGAFYHPDWKNASLNVAIGDKLEYRRDFNNAHDEFAIAVLHREQMLGWVPKEIASTIAPEIDNNGKNYIIEVTKSYPNDGYNDIEIKMFGASAEGQERKEKIWL